MGAQLRVLGGAWCKTGAGLAMIGLRIFTVRFLGAGSPSERKPAPAERCVAASIPASSSIFCISLLKWPQGFRARFCAEIPGVPFGHILPDQWRSEKDL